MVKRITKKPDRQAINAYRAACCLSAITWKFIRHVEDIADLHIAGNSMELAQVDKNHSSFLGKASLSNTFITLGEFALKLTQYDKTKDGRTETGEVQTFSELDIALVENFLNDLRPKAVVSVCPLAEMNSLDHTTIKNNEF